MLCSQRKGLFTTTFLGNKVLLILLTCINSLKNPLSKDVDEKLIAKTRNDKTVKVKT